MHIFEYTIRMQSFRDTFGRFIKPDDTLILAISWGVDSMVLFDLVKKIHSADKIIVAHFDHSLRWDESDGDRELVANICKSSNIVFEVKKMDIGELAKAEKMSLEAVARRERYAFLESVREMYDARYILTAHHADDQIETIILNLTKWAKVRGLSGMSVVSGYIFRPLLGVTKRDILTYAQEYSVSYREDSSNQQRIYERNRIRHDVVPVLESLNPSIGETVGELAQYMQEVHQFLTTQVESWLTQAEMESWKENCFLIRDFGVISPFFQWEILSYLYARAQWGSTHGLSRGLIAELTRFISDKNSYGKKEIKKLSLERRGERVFILHHKEASRILDAVSFGA